GWASESDELPTLWQAERASKRLTARVHHAARRRGRVAARGAGAGGGPYLSDRLPDPLRTPDYGSTPNRVLAAQRLPVGARRLRETRRKPACRSIQCLPPRG